MCFHDTPDGDDDDDQYADEEEVWLGWMKPTKNDAH